MGVHASRMALRLSDERRRHRLMRARLAQARRAHEARNPPLKIKHGDETLTLWERIKAVAFHGRIAEKRLNR